MTYRFRLLVAAFACAWLGLLLLGFAQSSRPSSRIQEDDPGWNCHTMGNHICGPQHINRDFKSMDAAFNCFAEVSYTRPNLTWNQRVAACSDSFQVAEQQ